MKGYFDKQYHLFPHKVKLDSASVVNTNYDDIVWPEPFVNVPAAYVVPVFDDSAVWTITPTTTGATLTVASGETALIGIEYFIIIFAHEKL